jgi:uncharacterized protein (TIGR03083 family)
MPLPPELYLAHLHREGCALARAYRDTEPDAAVGGCPGWTAEDLLAHLGEVHRWAAEIVRQGGDRPPSRRDLPRAPRGSGTIEWYQEGLELLMESLRNAGPDAFVWTFGPPSGRSGFWFRRQAQETLVHRWDMESAGGSAQILDPDLAADGIDELITLFLARVDDLAPTLGGTLHIHATDAEGEWTLRPDGQHLVASAGHAKADTALRGPAGDLLLYLWGRPVTGQVEILGDSELGERWRAAVNP